MVSGLTLTVLGCSGSYARPGGACSGYLVRAGDTTVWLDAGPGTLATLQQHVGLFDVDAVVLSHEHPDHWHDLEGYLVACRYGTPARAGVPVYAPSGLRERSYFELEPTFAWHEVAGGDRVAVGDVVTIIGPDGDERITAEEVATWSNTICYEVLTAIGPRVKRRYSE